MKHSNLGKIFMPLALMALWLALLTPTIFAEDSALRWWKGNTHTHTLWSDGDDYPEMVVSWYKEHGYDFLALSDHDVLAEGERWTDPAENRAGMPGLEKYRTKFGPEWVQTREEAGKLQVRLRTYEEFRPLFEEEGKFLLIQGEEISDHFENKPIHVNAINLQEVIPIQGGDSVYQVMQNNIDAVLEQRRRTGVPMIPHVNHPNFGWGIPVEDLMRLQGEQFFEVYNSHPIVYNAGDATHIGTERMWDIALAHRLTELQLPPLFGLATDDAHNYHEFATGKAIPGQGWIMVRAPHLSAEAIIAAMEAGDFYASTGVELAELRYEAGTLTVGAKPAAGVEYQIQFIGTRKPDPAGAGLQDEAIGMVLQESPGPAASYTLKGDELYVRAKVISNKPKPVPTVAAENMEMAWTQPVLPQSKR